MCGQGQRSRCSAEEIATDAQYVGILHFHCSSKHLFGLQQSVFVRTLSYSRGYIEPGGYIQWTEQDLLTCTIASAASENNVQQTEELQKFALSPTPYWPST